MGDFLHDMKRASEERAYRLLLPRNREDMALKLSQRGYPQTPRFEEAGIIAEIKPTSPTLGALTMGSMDLNCTQARARDYQSGGAVALSVLTEPTAFGGSLAALSAAAEAVDCPVMRKDFLVHPIQIDEAAVHGASGVLLIARLVPLPMLERMVKRARQLHLFVLIEVFEYSDIGVAQKILLQHPQCLIGVNTRDLKTLQIRPSALKNWVHHLPRHCLTVAESGLKTPQDILESARLGYRLHLVGTALMQAQDPVDLLKHMTEAARTQVAA